jgi:hypothetical protein
MTVHRAVGLTVFVFMLAGCTVLAPDHAATSESIPSPITPVEPPVAVTEVRPTVGEAEQLLYYFERIKRLQVSELAKEHEAVRTNYGRIRSDFNRISYAMLLSLPGTSFMDEVRALELLEPLVKRGEAGVRSLTFMLVTFIQERRRISGELSAMQQKLDALKSLERRLIERDQGNPGRK